MKPNIKKKTSTLHPYSLPPQTNHLPFHPFKKTNATGPLFWEPQTNCCNSPRWNLATPHQRLSWPSAPSSVEGCRLATSMGERLKRLQKAYSFFCFNVFVHEVTIRAYYGKYANHVLVSASLYGVLKWKHHKTPSFGACDSPDDCDQRMLGLPPPAPNAKFSAELSGLQGWPRWRTRTRKLNVLTTLVVSSYLIMLYIYIYIYNMLHIWYDLLIIKCFFTWPLFSIFCFSSVFSSSTSSAEDLLWYANSLLHKASIEKKNIGHHMME